MNAKWTLCAALGIAAQLAAQRRAASTTAAMLEQLGDEQHCLRAVRRLVQRGPLAVPALVAAVRHVDPAGDDRRYLMAVYALGKIGGGALPAVDLLLKHFEAARGRAERQLAWAIGEIAPSSTKRRNEILTRFERHTPAVGWNHQEWMIARKKLEIGTTPDRALLLSLLEECYATSLTAAGWALHRGHGEIDEEMRAALVMAYQRAIGQWQKYGEGFARPALALSRAIAQRMPDQAATSGALGNLLRHFDPEVRRAAAMALGRLGAGAATAVDDLIRALADSTTDVRREAVIALGVIGPAARRAVPRLGRLLDSDDTLTARLARAALRQIRGDRR